SDHFNSIWRLTPTHRAIVSHISVSVWGALGGRHQAQRYAATGRGPRRRGARTRTAAAHAGTGEVAGRASHSARSRLMHHPSPGSCVQPLSQVGEPGRLPIVASWSG